MSSQVANGLLAVLLGSVIAVALVVPVAAVLYRRRGEMPIGSLVVLLAAAIYGVALWTYTLVPFPATSDYVCTQPILEPFASFRQLRANGVRTPQLLAANPYFWQTALNVALFVPFGYFVRRVLGRGFLVAGLLGFTMSLLIETTQLTGVWGIFRCSYRFFEIDDLITNTTGAVIGSILSVVLVSNRPGRPARASAHPSRELTLGRRWMGMVCDLLWTVGTVVLVTVAYRAWVLYGDGAGTLGGRVEMLLGWVVAGVLQAVAVLGAGRTLGEWTVALGTQSRGAWPVAVSRMVKLVLGVGGFVALAVWGGPAWVLPGFLLLTWVGTWFGDHSGLANRLAGLRLRGR